MTALHLTPEQLNLKPQGDANPDAYLHGQVILCGCTCHVEAIQVERSEKDGRLTAVDSNYAESLDALYEVSNTSSPFQLATINDKKYVIMVYPHAN